VRTSSIDTVAKRPVKELKEYLTMYGIPMPENVLEKRDYADVIFRTRINANHENHRKEYLRRKGLEQSFSFSF